MKHSVRVYIRLIILSVVASVVLALSTTATFGSVHFKVTLDNSVATDSQRISGRLLIFMTKSDKPLETIEPDYTNPNAVYISGTEVRDLLPGKTIDIDADELSFP